MINNNFKSFNKNELINLFKKFVVIKEDIFGTSIHYQRINSENIFFKGSQKKCLNLLDRTIHQVYEPIIQKINKNSTNLKFPIPDNYRFAFRCTQDSNIILEEIRIIESNSKIRFIEDPKILQHWCDIFKCDGISTIFFGRLKRDIIDDILGSLEDINKKIYEILNKTERVSKSLTIKFLDKKNGNLSYKLYKGISNINERGVNSDIYSIVLYDSLEFIENLDLRNFNSDMETQHQRILDIVSQIYLKYIKQNNFEFKYIKSLEPAKFSENKIFDINLNKVSNIEVKIYLKTSKIYSDIYRLFLGNFVRERKSKSNLINSNIRKRINIIVKNIHSKTSELKKSNIMLEIPSFKEYYLKRYPDNYLPEGKLNLKYLERGKKKVNIMIGRFQPPTLGHIKILKNIYDQNNIPCVVIRVVSNNKKNPLPADLMGEVWDDIKNEFHFIEDIKTAKNAFIEEVINSLRPEYEPVLWGAGTDRVKSYQRFLNYKEESNALPEFQIYEIPRNESSISATKVRNSISNDDYNLFKIMTPKSTHKYYNLYKDYLYKDYIK